MIHLKPGGWLSEKPWRERVHTWEPALEQLL